MYNKKGTSKPGKNVRLTESGFNAIRKYVNAKGYKLGYFVEMAAIEKIKRDKK